MSRVPSYPGWLNLRDLGGLATADGRRVRQGRVLRSENPVLTDDQLAESLTGLGLALVVDLRSRAEAEQACQPWADHGVAYQRIPLSAGSQESWHARYTSYVEHRPANVAAAVGAVITAGDGAVLVHCAAGKDRTGVVVAMVLSLLGVPPEDIVDDYVLTVPAVEPILRRLEATGLYGLMTTPEFIEDQRPRPETMRSFLAWLDRHGGAEAWLLDHGVPADQVERFRAGALV